MQQYIIVDIDGTVANATHRKHLVDGSQKKDWDKFYDMCDMDEAHDDIIYLVNTLSAWNTVHPVVLVTGRVERVREKTVNWLKNNGLAEFDGLIMRPDGDYTPDHILKIKMAADVGLTPDEVLLVLDDRSSVVKAWRAAGYRTLQVAEGDF